jgi:polar amino acid transport system substrate-binding protein
MSKFKRGVIWMGSDSKGQKARVRPADSTVARRDLLAASAGAVAVGRWAAAAGAGTLAAAFLATRANAQQQTKSKLYDVINRKMLIVGTGNGNPPWHFQDEKGDYAGFDISLARILAKGLFNDPTKVQFVVQAADARIPSLLTDKVDINFQFMTITALRAQQVQFSIPYYREGVGLLMNNGSSYKDYNALVGAGNRVKVSVLQNVTADEMVHAALPKAQVLQLDSEANAIQAVDSKRADAGAVDASTVRWLTIKFPGKYKDSGFGWFANWYAASMKPGDDIWLTFVNTVLLDAMGGLEWPTYKAEYAKYFGITLADPPVGFPDAMRLYQSTGQLRVQ